MARISAAIVSVLIAAAAATPASAASFNCYAHLTRTEAAICGNARLSGLDSQMASAYKALIRAAASSGPSVRSIQDNQRLWLGFRNRCGTNVSCLTTQYVQKIDDLRNYAP